MKNKNIQKISKAVAVIMAGGKGIRLRPLTKHCPKPMVKVGGKPILERIIQELLSNGIGKFYISINYLGEMVESYFGDGKKFACDIQYLKEKKYLHTGGSLSLIKEEITSPILVMNGDLVTKINFQHLLEFHRKGKFIATICTRPYQFTIPFGVIKTRKNSLVSLEEKPSGEHLINMGIYVLEPKLLKMIPANQVFPLTDLFKKLLIQKQKIGVYQTREDWIDVGQIDELKKAQEEYLKTEEKCLENLKKS